MTDKKITLRGDMIKGEIDRMCITDQQVELDWMCLCAIENIIKLRSEKRKVLFTKGFSIVETPDDSISLDTDRLKDRE